MCYPTEISSLMDFGTPDCSLGKGMASLWKKKKIQSVALATAGSVHSDLPWQLEDTELSAWLGGWCWSRGLCRLRVWEQSDNISGYLVTRASLFSAGFDLSQLNNLFCHPMLSAGIRRWGLIDSLPERSILLCNCFNLNGALLKFIAPELYYNLQLLHRREATYFLESLSSVWETKCCIVRPTGLSIIVCVVIKLTSPQ